MTPRHPTIRFRRSQHRAQCFKKTFPSLQPRRLSSAWQVASPPARLDSSGCSIYTIRMVPTPFPPFLQLLAGCERAPQMNGRITHSGRL
eukprot:6178427-Pleurochrysis_carterae.AAC.2